MMKITLLFFTLIFSIIAQEPVFSFVAYDPWAMVMGADSPQLTVYDDGMIIYQTEDGYSQILKDSIGDEITSFKPDNLSEFDEYYSVSNWTDQPTFLFWWQDKKVQVYGVFWAETDEIIPPKKPEGKVSKRKREKYERELRKYEDMLSVQNAINAIPTELKDLASSIQKIRHIKSKSWLPEYIEVLFWPYEYAPNVIEWPSNFPKLDDPNTKTRRNDSYSVYVPSNSQREFIEFMKSIPQKTAVLINGKKMAISFRYPFPKEQMWMN